jgi:hypothetical protein
MGVEIAAKAGLARAALVALTFPWVFEQNG